MPLRQNDAANFRCFGVGPKAASDGHQQVLCLVIRMDIGRQEALPQDPRLYCLAGQSGLLRCGQAVLVHSA